MLKTFRLRRFVGVLAAILGVAALGLAQTSELPPVCKLQDTSWAIADGGCKDLKTGLVWSYNCGTRSGTLWSWANAINDCSAYDNGFSDWRLPTVSELQTAYKDGAWAHLQDGSAPECWSNQAKGNKAYSVNLISGLTSLHLKGSGFESFCVRQ